MGLRCCGGFGPPSGHGCCRWSFSLLQRKRLTFSAAMVLAATATCASRWTLSNSTKPSANWESIGLSSILRRRFLELDVYYSISETLMPKQLQVLIVEDDERDAALLLRELRRGGYEPVSERVETREDLRIALQRRAWDIVVSDYSMPRFSAPEALSIVRE